MIERFAPQCFELQGRYSRQHHVRQHERSVDVFVENPLPLRMSSAPSAAHAGKLAQNAYEGNEGEEKNRKELRHVNPIVERILAANTLFRISDR